MRYERSKTAMDEAAVFTPASQLRMGRMGLYMNPSDPALLSSNPPGELNITKTTRGLSAYYRNSGARVPDASAGGPLDMGSVTTLGRLGDAGEFGTGDYSYVYGDEPAAGAALPSTAPGGTSDSGGTWNWQAMMDKAPALLRDLMLARDTTDYRNKIAAINLERAKRGQPPLPMDQYAPMVQVGVAPQTMKVAGIGVGAFVAIAVATALGVAALMKRRA